MSNNETQWGNIGPDSIHDPKWNRKRTKAQKEKQSKVIEEKYKDDLYKEFWQGKNVERWDNEEWRKQHLQKMAEGRTEEIEKARIEAVRNSEKHKKMMAKRWADPEFRKKIKEANSKPMSEEAKKHLSKLNKGKTIPQETLDKLAKTRLDLAMSNQKVNKQCRSINTPDGVFHNLRLASQHFKTGKGTIIRRCKNTKNPKFADWYYLD